jgi:hypothetical protein
LWIIANCLTHWSIPRAGACPKKVPIPFSETSFENRENRAKFDKS